MAVLRTALFLVLVFSLSELVVATRLAMNQTIMEAIKQKNLTDVFNTKNPECDVSLLRIVQELTNTTSSLNGTAEALNVSVDLLKSGCLDYTLLEMAGLQAEPPQSFLRTATFDKVVKQVCESNFTDPTKAQLGNVLHSIAIEKKVETNITVAALVTQRILEENDTESSTVLKLLQTALNVTERELIESGLLNVSSRHLGFLNHTLDELACIVGVPKDKLRSFSLSQLLSVTYSFRPLMHKITNLTETWQNFVLNSTVLQMANNNSDTLSNKTLLQLAAGSLPEYFAPFILNIPCQQAHPWNYTVDRFEELTSTNLTDVQNRQFAELRWYIQNNKEFFESEIEAKRVKIEEVKELAKKYGVELHEFLQAQGKSIVDLRFMTLFEINNLFCYNSLYRYSKKRDVPMDDIAAMLNMTSEELRGAPFEQCRKLIPRLIEEDVRSTFGYPVKTTNSLLGCKLAPAHDARLVDWCSLMKRHSLPFTLDMYGKLRITLYGKTVLDISQLIGLNLSDYSACNLGIRNQEEIDKLSKYPLSRIEKELKMGKHKIISKSLLWIIQKVINDTDECKQRTHKCRLWGNCINTLLGYECKCPSEGRYIEPYCEDFNECTSKVFPDNCHEGRQFCHNTPGSFYCGSCYKGYYKVNETYCEDEDECDDREKNTCYWSNKQCINTIGSYECACGRGLRISKQNRCKDINECDLKPAVCGHIPNAQCKNFYSGYSCNCPRGFEKVLNSTSDLHNCTDIDECTLEPGLCRGKHEECKNIPGKYVCSCKEGYERHQGKCREIRPRFTINTGLASFLTYRGDFALVRVPGGLPYCGETYDNLWIHSNGLISIGPFYSRKNPQNLDSLKRNVLAPFWANSDVSDNTRIAYQILDRSEKNQTETVDDVSKFISDSENLDSSFNATWVLIVSWQNVSPFSMSRWTLTFNPFFWPFFFWSRSNPYKDEKNTFGAVVATNGTHTYAVFFYDDMNWYRTYLSRKAVVGFATKDERCKYQVPGSFKKEIFNIDDQNFQDKNGKERNGVITFSLNSDKIPPITDLKRCVDWYQNEPDPEWAEDLPPCPCDEMAARYSSEFNLVSNGAYRRVYELTFPDRDEYGQRCVYRRFFLWNSYSLALSSNDRSSAQRYHPTMRDKHRVNDQNPYKWCCASKTTDNRFCGLYYEKRPSSECGLSRPPTFSFISLGHRRRPRFRFRRRRSPPRPFFAFVFGDPHITTLDGVKYTFNGLGDYVLVSVNNTFAFHGRTARPKTPDGPANATIFSGFAISQAGGDSVQVLFSADKPNNMSITVVSSSNCSHYIFSDFKDPKTFNKISVRHVPDKNITLRVSAASGISVDISVGLLGMLNLGVTVPEKMTNRTQGLMGRINGDKSDDYAYRNGTILTVVNATESQQEVFDMGQSWKVQDNERLFVNSTCAKENVSFDANFVPAFFDWDSLGDLRENATRICGDNLECLFDIAQTKNVNVGKETIGFEKESNKIKEVLNNQPPVLHGPAEVNAECGKTVKFQINSTDQNNDSLSYMVSGLPAGATFDNYTATVTWNVTNAKNVSIIVIVTDQLGASTQQAITINLCCCQNNGECSHNETVVGKGTENFRFMKCNCSALYDGDLCENERDPCADKPCYDETVSCTKSLSNDKGYTCSACPEGLTGNGEDCIALDKCATNNGGCGQICNNSLGTVNCECLPGFRLNDDGKNCTDIDECDVVTGNNDCAANATCTNGPGNYSCECRKGFEGNPKQSCTDINECGNGVAQCSQVCENLPGSFKCSCKQGFQLGNDNATCEDIDECKFTITNKCQMKCINLFSTYNCSCPAGFQLKSDHRNCEVVASSRCDSTNGGCVNGLCANSSGNITCHCSSGFNLTADGKTCEDVDECQHSNHGGCNQHCNNLQGGYNCSCNPGFTLLQDKRTCQDVDECKAKPCSTNAKCRNMPGNYSCECNAGYTGDGKKCSNINECEERSPCGRDKKCTDLIGSYSCKCPFRQADLGSGVCERVKKFYISCRFIKLKWRPEYSDTETGIYKDLVELIVTETNKFWRKLFGGKFRGCRVRNVWRGSIGANISLFFNSNATVSTSDLTNTMKNASEFGQLAIDPSAAKATDPDECSDANSNDCHANAVCTNTQGSYECKCKDGYEGDGLKCEPKIATKKDESNTKLILAIVIPLVCVLLLIIIFCVYTRYDRRRSRKKRFTSDEQHEYIYKHQLTERGAGRPVSSNEYIIETSDKNARKESASSEESGPMYDNPDPTGSYDKSHGAFVNHASSETSLQMYENPGATSSYDMSQGDGTKSNQVADDLDTAM